MTTPLNPYVSPECRKELWADPPRPVTPAVLADLLRAKKQKERSEAWRANPPVEEAPEECH